jgi:hypothetical protein
MESSSGGKPFKITTSGIALSVAFIGQLILTVNWAVHQEARITASEAAVANVQKRFEIASAILERIEERSRSLAERVDRQETPLARRVDALEARTLDSSNRLLTHEGRINEIFNILRK